MTEGHETGNDDKGARQRMGDGIRSGIGVLSAFKDALEETIRDARERGDLSTDRAKELMREALDKAQTAASDARERLDFVNHTEFEDLRDEVEALTKRVSALETLVAGQARTSATKEEPEEN